MQFFFCSRPYGEHLSKIVLNLEQLLFKEASIFSFGGHFVQPTGIFNHVKVLLFFSFGSGGHFIQ